MLSVISASIAPGIALLSYFYLKDRYETEPIGMVIRSFVIGALLVFPVMVIQYAFQSEGVLQSPFANAFILTGLLEEFFKWFIVIYTAYHHAAFNEHYDGIVYATAVSLGFATAENMFYLFAYGIDFALFRALLPVSSHALFGVIMGYYIGRAKFSKHQKRWLFIGLISAVFLHGVYDLVLINQSYWVYAIIPFMIYLWWSALRKIKLAHYHQQLWQHNHPQKIINKPFK